MTAAQSRDDVKRMLVGLLPPGSEQLYDLADTAFIGATLSGLAGAFKDTLIDRVAVLRGEVNPSTIEENLPEWEQACGLAFTPISLFGTIAQRRNAVIAALRMSGSFSLDDIRAIVQPYFLYQDPSLIQILETPRTSYSTAHTYTNLLSVTTSTNMPGLTAISVNDEPRVSRAGATVYVLISTTRPDRTSFTVVAPDGASVTFGTGWVTADPTPVTTALYVLYAPAFAGHRIKGNWQLIFKDLSAAMTLESWAIFVEGEGDIFDGAMPPNRIGQGLGAGIFEFAVVANPALLGTGFDLQGAQRAITRWKPAHTRGVVSLVAPVTGTACAIPGTDNAIPDRAIPC